MRFTSCVFLLLTAAHLAGQPHERLYRIESGRSCQTIDGFGASDAWSMQAVGLWPKKEQRQVADWLFSTDDDDRGNPKGIGLSIWRFNVGAGSAEQGDSSQIQPGTRTECFLQADGTYDWSKQAGQRRFLQLARERGVPTFLAFLNSPPVWFTKNGLATNTGRSGGTFNLKEECYDDFACFLAEVMEGLERQEGIQFAYLCPVNEPDGHWNWTGPKQEGTPATKQEIARVVRRIAKEFAGRGLYTQLLVPESSDYRCLMQTHMTDSRRGYQIQSYFCPDSTDTYLGNVPNVSRLIAGHSYWTNTPLDMLHDCRKALRDTLDKYGADFWQTETCIMSNDEEIGGGGGYDFTMKTALYVARIIHHDLVLAGARSWQWWRALGGNYKDGLLRMYDRPGRADYQTARDSKLLWALGNYSRFVRPGAVRLPVTVLNEKGRSVPEGDTDPDGLMCSAYRNADGRLVIVVINYAGDPMPFTFKTDKWRTVRRGWNLYRTSDAAGEDLAFVGTMRARTIGITLPPRSITTFVSR